MHKSLVVASLAALLVACSGGGGGTGSGSSGSPTTTSGSGNTSGSGTTTSGSSGTASGSTTGCTITTVCKALGDACNSPGDCCSDLTCKSGTCTSSFASATCSQDGQPCQTSADCCGDASAGTQLACVPGPNGGKVCHLGLFGEPCDAATPCAPDYTCIPPAAASNASSSSGSSSGSGSTSSGSGSSTASDSGSGSSAGSDSGSSAGSDSGSSTGTDSGSGSGSGSSGSGSDSGSSGSSGTVNADPLVPGTCGFASERPGGPVQCIGTGPLNKQTKPCYAGDPCDPNSDFCNSGGNLVCDSTQKICVPNYAQALGTACTHDADCQAAPGQPKLVCNTDIGLCAEPCASDSDCKDAVQLDTSNNNPPAISLLCDGSGSEKSCVPLFCYDANGADDGSNLPADTSVLYQPCQGHPDSLCEPQYYGDGSGVFGFCQATRPNEASGTLGQACAESAGPGYPDAICGSDAVCLGGVCQAICDAAPAAATESNAPHCAAGGTCISAQGVNVTSRNQVGGCGTPCDPWTTDEAASGCNTFCGGPKAVCRWIIGDKLVGQPLGYCAAAPTQQLALGADCSGDPSACPQGTFCLGNGDANNPQYNCVQMCDAKADGGPDSCPAGKTCTSLFGPTAPHAGYCQ